MSPLAIPSLSDITDRLSARTARYCDRAAVLVRDPSLTTATAATALDHLAALQSDLATERLRQCKPMQTEIRGIESKLKPLEHRLKAARTDVSNALLRAKPEENSAFGLVAHGKNPDPVIEEENDEGYVPCGTPRAVSACRALLDLEALRPYLSEQALRQAIEKCRKETGEHRVRGVTYAVLPASAHLPCEIG